MRAPRTLTAAVFALVAALAAPPLASAHTPPPIYISVAVGQEDVVWEMTLSAGIFEDWLPLKAKALDTLEGEAKAKAKELIEAFVDKWGAVTIDGVPVRGILLSAKYQEFTDHEIPWEYVQIRMAYGAKGMPRQVSLVWRNYDGGLGGYFDRVESEIEGGGETSYYLFRDSEPEVVWHAPVKREERPPPALPTTQGPVRLPVPLVSAGLGLLTVVALLGLARRRSDRRGRWIVAATGLALVLGFWGVARTEVALPFQGGAERPSDEDARAIFEARLRNIYRAFDYETESDVYDTLAHSVTGDLLADLYLQIHQTLINQDAGGAVSKVQKVEITEVEVLPPEDRDAAWFKVRATWQVQGKVGHWGHTHIRLNQYRAIFTVTPEPDGWKIAGLDLQAQERLDDGSMGGR